MKKRKVKLNAIALFMLLSVVSCKNGKNTDVDNNEKGIEDYAYGDRVKESTLNLENYCYSDNAVNKCGSIVSQAPISIENYVKDDSLESLHMNYENSTIDILNNGHTIEFKYNGKGTLSFAGDNYSLLQFHFHSTIDDSHHSLEAHLVHANESKDLAVVSIFFETGKENKFLAQFINHLPKDKDGTYTETNLNYNVSSLFPSNLSYFNYNGTLTTPPCSEIVEWIVLEASVEVSKRQIDKISSVLHDNFRQVQPKKGRTIKYFSNT